MKTGLKKKRKGGGKKGRIRIIVLWNVDISVHGTQMKGCRRWRRRRRKKAVQRLENYTTESHENETFQKKKSFSYLICLWLSLQFERLMNPPFNRFIAHTNLPSDGETKHIWKAKMFNSSFFIYLFIFPLQFKWFISHRSCTHLMTHTPFTTRLDCPIGGRYWSVVQYEGKAVNHPPFTI